MNSYGIYSDRLRILKEGLNIENSQAFKWARLEASIEAALKVLPRAGYGTESLSKYPSLPATLENELQRTLYRADACRAICASVDSLYVVLSDKQRRLADRLLLPVLNDVLAARPGVRGRRLAAA
jgi:hypothetical protein